MDYFKKEISSSGEPYFRNKLTNQTQWGFNTYENTNKLLPRGYIRLIVNGKSFYKYNEQVLPSSYDYYSYGYAPRELQEILQMSYNDLIKEEEQEQQAEISRRNILFENVANLLKLERDSICDESLEFLAGKADVPIKRIITYIEETETEKLGEKATLTSFSTIKSTDSSFSSKRSIRELCGLNMRKVEAQNALSQIQHQFTCIISQNSFIDPVTCSSGHTFEREYITRLIRSSNPVCPFTRLRLTGLIFPNHALKNVIDQFIEKYKNQKGEHWVPILEFCAEYTKGSDKRLKTPIDVKREPVPVPVPVPVRAPVNRYLDTGLSANEIRNSLIASRYPGNSYRDTGRSANEIRNFLIECGYDLDIIDNIPEYFALSTNSSFFHALLEVQRRIGDPVFRESHRSRTAEELLAYYARINPRYTRELRTPGAYDAAVQTVNSPYNSYASAGISRLRDYVRNMPLSFYQQNSSV
jgi:hypothetical protein